MSRRRALELGVPRWATGVAEENLKLPQVRDRLDQSAAALQGLVFIVAGVLVQTWALAATPTAPVVVGDRHLDLWSVLSALSGCATLAIALWLVSVARRNAVAHIQAHLDGVRPWARGPHGRGWSEDALDQATLVRWHHPRNAVLQLGVGTSLAEISLVESALLPQEVRRNVVLLTNAVHALNAYLQRIDAFTMADTQIYLSVARKLDALNLQCGAPDGAALTVDDVVTRSGLTEVEQEWAKELCALYWTLHVKLIGSPTGAGVHGHLRQLERSLAMHGWSH